MVLADAARGLEDLLCTPVTGNPPLDGQRSAAESRHDDSPVSQHADLLQKNGRLRRATGGARGLCRRDTQERSTPSGRRRQTPPARREAAPMSAPVPTPENRGTEGSS